MNFIVRYSMHTSDSLEYFSEGFSLLSCFLRWQTASQSVWKVLTNFFQTKETGHYILWYNLLCTWSIFYSIKNWKHWLCGKTYKQLDNTGSWSSCFDCAECSVTIRDIVFEVIWSIWYEDTYDRETTHAIQRCWWIKRF